MISFGEDEQSLFRHHALHKSKECDLILTDVRLLIVPNTGTEVKQFTWPNISGVKYSPSSDAKGRAMVLLKTVIRGEEDVVVQLVGSSKEANFMELERLKGIVTQMRKSKPATLPGASSSHNRPTNSSTKIVDRQNAEILGRRKLLLDADRNLAKQYRELVELDKLISEEEFWQSHDDRMQQSAQSAELKLIANKGKQNALLTDAYSKDSKGNLTVNLTMEIRQNIFSMYPEVKRAFEKEVPLKQSETEFWKAYFQSEYYNASNRSSNTFNVVHRDDLFSRYVVEGDSGGASGGTGAGTGAGATSRTGEKQRNLAGMVAPSMDLTASFGDYRAPERLDPSDQLEGGADAGAGAGAGAGSMLSVRYNKSSSLVLDSVKASGATAGVGTSSKKRRAGEDFSELAGEVGAKPNSGGGGAYQLTELNNIEEPAYVAVKFNNVHPGTGEGGTVGVEQSEAAAVAVKAEAEVQAGCPVTVTVRLAVMSPAQMMQSCLPAHASSSSDRCNRYFLADVAKMRKLHNQQASLSAGSGKGGATASLLSSSSSSAVAQGGSSRNFDSMGLAGFGADAVQNLSDQTQEDGSTLSANFKQVK
jgi:hypothetical protein